MRGSPLCASILVAQEPNEILCYLRLILRVVKRKAVQSIGCVLVRQISAIFEQRRQRRDAVALCDQYLIRRVERKMPKGTRSILTCPHGARVNELDERQNAASP